MEKVLKFVKGPIALVILGFVVGFGAPYLGYTFEKTEAGGFCINPVVEAPAEPAVSE